MKKKSELKKRGIPPRTFILLILAAVVILGASVVFEQVSSSSGQVFPVYISEVMASNSSYPNAEGICCDYLEIHNSADYPVDLSGFQLGDIAGKARYAFPADCVILPDEYLVVYCNKAVKSDRYAPFEISRSGGESFYLIAKNGAMVDTVITTALDSDHVMVRTEAGEWTVSNAATPGRPTASDFVQTGDIYNAGVSSVRISEFTSAKNGYLPEYGMSSDWVELYNTADESVDISGFTLSDNVGNDKYAFPQGTVIDGHGYLVIPCTDRVTNPGIAPFGLSRVMEETIILKDAFGRIIEIVTCAPLEQGSVALNAEGEWAFTELISPGFANDSQGCEAFIASIGAEAGAVRISEVMSADQILIPDSFGEFSDWVELYNSTDRTIDLDGWCLSDDPADPAKWMIRDLVLQPGERTLIFCSGRGVNAEGEIHADFSLSAGGESLTLTAHSGHVVDAVNFPASQTQCSFIFDSEGTAVATDCPTPGYPNDEQGYEAFCDSLIPAGPLAIWEVMTANDTYLPQKLGECFDWVELRNVSDQELDLSGYSISDDPETPGMHVLSSRTLAPGESFIVILSTEADVAKPGFEQALFSLNAREDQLFLFGPDGALLDYVYLKEIPAGFSYGRSEQQGGFSYMEPSPANPNNAGYRLISGAIVSSYVPGVYVQQEDYTVTLEARGEIYYTTDGSVPTERSSRYTEPLEIGKTTVVRAVSVEPGKLASDVYTATFVVGPGHTLPVVSLVTDPSHLWGPNGIYKNGDIDVKEIRVPSNVAYSGSDGSFSMDCSMNMHGATTVTSFDKKTFALRFQDQYDGPLEYDVFEDGEVTRFSSLLIRTAHESSFSSQMHDTVIHDVASQCTDQLLTQKYKYAALYLNGEYWGLYAIRERHSAEHYASYMDVPADTVQIVRYMTDERNSLNQLYKFLDSNSLLYEENYAYVKSILDVESFADWLIFEVYMDNIDIYGNIRYYQSSVDGLWRLGLADLDLGMVGQVSAFANIDSTFHHGRLIKALLDNEEFQHLIASRLAEYLSGPLSDENMIARITQMADQIRPETEGEEERWGTPTESWEYTVKEMLRFCDGRAKKMIDSLCARLGFTKQEREMYFGHLE